MSDVTSSSRVERIGDATLAVLADRGARGLTHRAVDEAAGLPPGSTSYYARTRAALLGLAVERAADLEADEVAADVPPKAVEPRRLAVDIADRLYRLLRGDRARSVARYELALEAGRRPELKQAYDRMGKRFRDVMVTALTEAGSTDPQRHGRALLAWCEGVLFDTTAGAGSSRPPGRRELRRTATELLTGMLAAGPVDNAPADSSGRSILGRHDDREAQWPP